jgi:transcriptional regulator with XRE-family HTH domain
MRNSRKSTLLKPANGLSMTNMPARIREFRYSRNLSQIELAILCGKSRRTITTWETTGPGTSNEAMVMLALSYLNSILPIAR